jgi:23S rRNA (guanosine2251-2'-O)-methyltransferase
VRMSKKHKNKTSKFRHNQMRRDKHQEKSDQKHKKKIKAPTLFGTHAVREAWLNPQRQIHHLYITESALSAFNSAITRAQKAGLERPSPYIVEKDMLSMTLPKGTVHQGIALVCDPLPECDIMDLIIKAKAKSHAVILILDQVTDPHNVGALIRSASALGTDGMIMQRRHAPELTGILAKTACGAVDHLDVAYETNLSRSIESLQTHGFMVYGLDERGAINIGDIRATGHIALVLGAEGTGLRRLVSTKCDQLIRLPTSGAISSLNVSNAGAVALYAMTVR